MKTSMLMIAGCAGGYATVCAGPHSMNTITTIIAMQIPGLITTGTATVIGAIGHGTAATILIAEK